MLNRRRALQISAALGLGGALAARGAGTPEPLNDRLRGNISPVHDPCAIRAGDTYYVFSTNLGGDGDAQIPWRFSKDLISWEKGGHVFDGMPDWASEYVPDIEGIWAPDISFFDGRYWLYYACSTPGRNRSAIGLATNTALDPDAPGFKWQDRGLVFKSDTADPYNAIDPNRIIGSDGRHWLAFGSFWGGLKLIELDPASGKPAANPKIYSLARRPADAPLMDAIEASFIIERDGWYYLFCSFDFCCRGADSNYYTVVGRAKDATGPYGDARNDAMIDGNATVVLPFDPSSRWRGPGGASILRDGDKDYIVYHAYDARRDGTPTLRIAPLVWSAAGWPTAII